MGVKCNEACTSIGVELVKGDLIFYIGKKRYVTNIPGLKNVTCSKQCRFIHCARTFALLKNNEYKIILWRNGIGQVMTLDDYLLLTFRFTLPKELARIKVTDGGVLINTENNKVSFVSLFTEDGENYILGSEDYLISVSLCKADNQLYFDQVQHSRIVTSPALTLSGNSLTTSSTRVGSTLCEIKYEDINVSKGRVITS